MPTMKAESVELVGNADCFVCMAGHPKILLMNHSLLQRRQSSETLVKNLSDLAQVLILTFTEINIEVFLWCVFFRQAKIRWLTLM